MALSYPFLHDGRFMMCIMEGMHKDYNIVVFTDLDGSLLDHHSYDYKPALPALERLSVLHIPVVPTTSKTIAEIECLNIDHFSSDMIAENGMVALYGGVQNFIGKPYSEILTFIDKLPENLRSHIVGFSQMDIAESSYHTGLSNEKAALAKQRLASEPFLWRGDEGMMQQLQTYVTSEGLSLTMGGRFYHLMSAGGKDYAMRWYVDKHADLISKPVISIALGDGWNDVDMLAQADYGVVIPSAAGTVITVENPKGRIMRADHAGPAGWCSAMNRILDDLGLD